MKKLRQGRRVGRHLYIQEGPNPADTDPPVGMVDTPELARRIVETVNGADTKLADMAGELAQERTRIRAAILYEIDDIDPDGTMRELLADTDRDGDPGHPGNSWWRAYCELAGMMRALGTIDNPGADPVGQLAMNLQHAERENRRLRQELAKIKGGA